jgi:hypothetical protein
MKRALVGLSCLAALLAIVVSAPAQGPPPGRPPRFQLGNLLPPHVKEELNLTTEQQKQLAELEAEVKGKLEKILTAEQKQQIDRHRPPTDGPRPPIEDEDHGRPVAAIAKELGVTPEQFREAFKKVQPAPAGGEPTAEQRQRNRKVLSEALGVSPERLDEVMDKYRPGGRGTNGPPRPR